MQTAKKWFRLSVVSFFVSSMAIWFMPLGSFDGGANQRILSYSLAAILWLGFIMGFVFLRLVGRHRKSERGYIEKKGIEFFRFFSNKPARVFDALMLAAILTLALSQTVFRAEIPASVTLTATFATVFCVEMHGVFNGNNYRYVSGGE